MNEVIKNIKERRSVRAYRPEQIKEKELNEILEAGYKQAAKRIANICLTGYSLQEICKL